MMKKPVTDVPDTVGRYLIERLIAHGGMGSVYLARDPAIDRLLVIKLLRAGFDDETSRERFAREARAAGRLHHPNIVTVFDVGEHDRRPFIAMEYVAGETLAHFIRRRAASRVTHKLRLLEDLCAGLHYAHLAGVVHRDVKPANIMHSHEGLVKILDFGIARTGAPSLTRQGDVAGTLNYMSPEQLIGEPVDHRADVYAAGVVAYELVTNHMAFPGSIDTGVLHRILHAEPVPVAALEPGIDPELDAIIRRAMARDREARYEDLDAMACDLAAVRVRLAASEVDEDLADPQAETRVDSVRIASSTPRPSSRGGSRLAHRARAIAAASSARRRSPSRKAIWIGAAAVAIIVVLAAALLVDRAPDSLAPVAANEAASVAAPQAALPATAPVQSPPLPQEPPRLPKPAPDGLRSAGGSLSPPPATDAPAARGPAESSSPSQPQAPPAAATALEREKPASKAPSSAAAADPPLVEASPTLRRTAPLAPTLEPKAAVTGALRDPPPDPRAAEEAAIRQTLARYKQAYEGLDSAAVGALIPSLSAEQLRNLSRDFSNYRRYTVEIRGEQIVVNDGTATVTCQVLRSFETKSGVEGSNVVSSTFQLRRNETRWIIERVEATGRRDDGPS